MNYFTEQPPMRVLEVVEDRLHDLIVALMRETGIHNPIKKIVLNDELYDRFATELKHRYYMRRQEVNTKDINFQTAFGSVQIVRETERK